MAILPLFTTQPTFLTDFAVLVPCLKGDFLYDLLIFRLKFSKALASSNFGLPKRNISSTVRPSRSNFMVNRPFLKLSEKISTTTHLNSGTKHFTIYSVTDFPSELGVHQWPLLGVGCTSCELFLLMPFNIWKEFIRESADERKNGFHCEIVFPFQHTFQTIFRGQPVQSRRWFRFRKTRVKTWHREKYLQGLSSYCTLEEPSSK